MKTFLIEDSKQLQAMYSELKNLYKKGYAFEIDVEVLANIGDDEYISVSTVPFELKKLYHFCTNCDTWVKKSDNEAIEVGASETCDYCLSKV